MNRVGLALVCLIAASGLGLATTGRAQTAPAATARPDMIDRFYRGRALINAAVQAAGGAQALRGINAISYVVTGDVSNDIQGYSAARIGNPARDGALRITNRFDFANARFYQQIQQNFDSGYDSAFATIWRNGTQYAPRWVPRDYTETPNAPSPFAAGGAVMVSSRWLPPIILQRALQNFRSAAWVGEGSTAGGPADIVEVSFDETTRFRLIISRADSKVRRVEAMAPDPISGDDVSIAELSGDQTIAGIVFPTNIRAVRRGAATQVLRLGDVAINPTFTDVDFSPPADFTRITPTPRFAPIRYRGVSTRSAGWAAGPIRFRSWSWTISLWPSRRRSAFPKPGK